ncbi:D12 class N6 adenine-specific DNA methyltransferase, partial [Fusobacterium equinum]
GITGLFFYCTGGNMKIKKPFRYMGSKGRFYNEIKGIFEENKKEKYVDLFAGGMEVAVNLKEDFPDVQILANIKDEHVESFVKHRKAVLGQYLKVIDFIYQGTEKEDARKTYYKKKEWGQLKARYREFWNENPLGFSVEERLYIGLICSMNKGRSLSSSFYSENKVQTLKKYLQKMENIHIKHEFFNKNWQFNHSFILLDPPYVTSTKAGNSEKKGYNYKKGWKEKDDLELVAFIKSNQNRNNVFMVFGSVGNPLSRLIQNVFPEATFTIKKYKKSMFGRSSEREEWYCVIK